MKRNYADYTIERAASIIIGEVLVSGKSEGWCGLQDSLKAVEKICNRHGVHYVDDWNGGWEKKHVTYEVCPHCEEEVRLDAELKVQTCPNCGKRIVTCSMCRACDTPENYCTHCCLDYQARVENAENEA